MIGQKLALKWTNTLVATSTFVDVNGIFLVFSSSFFLKLAGGKLVHFLFIRSSFPLPAENEVGYMYRNIGCVRRFTLHITCSLQVFCGNIATGKHLKAIAQQDMLFR